MTALERVFEGREAEFLAPRLVCTALKYLGMDAISLALESPARGVK